MSKNLERQMAVSKPVSDLDKVKQSIQAIWLPSVFEYLPDGSFDKTREHVTMGINRPLIAPEWGGDRCDAEGWSEAMNLQGRSCWSLWF
jgi:hypothetical protein